VPTFVLKSFRPKNFEVPKSFLSREKNSKKVQSGKMHRGPLRSTWTLTRSTAIIMDKVLDDQLVYFYNPATGMFSAPVDCPLSIPLCRLGHFAKFESGQSINLGT
jgi:hypothetical protein